MSKVLLLSILFVGGFLLFYRLSELMIFIGDQGWFYLSARDMLITGKVPLVGIASSHPWLHQGPLWTYFLAFILWVGNFNPLVPGFVAASIGLVTIWFIYFVGKRCFSERVGLLAALLYATSPLVIIHARIPYHTTPIPFFVLLWFWAMYQWAKGKLFYFPVVLFSLAILYNLELATQLLWGILILIFGYGFWSRKDFVEKLRNKKILMLSFLAFFIPMLPILLYDITHGFPQTLRFIAWIGYRILKVFGLFGPSMQENSIGDLTTFFLVSLQRLLFLENQWGALLIFIVSFFTFLISLSTQWRKKKFILADVLLGIVILISFFGLLVTKTPSEAYLPMLYPFLILMVAVFFAGSLTNKKTIGMGSFAIILIVASNSYILLSQNYLMNEKGYGPTFSQRVAVAEEIVQKTKGGAYRLGATGEGSQFASFTMNTEYLTWWLGNAPAQEAGKEFVIEESLTRIKMLEK